MSGEKIFQMNEAYDEKDTQCYIKSYIKNISIHQKYIIHSAR